ncbi:MAG: hypothetical protein QN198_00845 [Armatimonadota bacterium]|nr:hypothetical protein [Armatimonadota bacterium]MDR5702129.1 hypothetical protein [Armatimonadota bacterium]
MVLRASTREILSHPREVVLISLFTSAPFLSIAAGPFLPRPLGPLFFLAGWLLLGPVLMAAWESSLDVLEGRQARLWRGLRQHLIQGLLFFLLNALAILLTMANFRFYVTSPAGVLTSPLLPFIPGLTLGVVFGLLWLYVLVLWGLIQLYAMPLVLIRRVGVMEGFRTGAVLVIKNAGFSAGLMVVASLLLGVLLLTGLGVILLAGGTLSILTLNATKALLKNT